MSESIKVPIKIHPRAFSAFGEDLITNENIAMIELVKNSYDAYALKVEIEFGFDKRGIPFISITDDGCGMTKDTIENAWATIATFYKKARPYISRTFKIVDDEGKIQTIERTRTVSGNKGLTSSWQTGKSSKTPTACSSACRAPANPLPQSESL